MGAEIEGSSTAAQSAQDIDTNQTEVAIGDETEPGLFSRVIAAFRAPDSDDETSDRNGNGRAMLGLGNLRAKRVEDVVIPRAEIVSVPKSIGLDDLVGVFRDSGLTRLPVFEDTLDSPIGMIHLKDLALRHGASGAVCAALDAYRGAAGQNADRAQTHGAGD